VYDLDEDSLKRIERLKKQAFEVLPSPRRRPHHEDRLGLRNAKRTLISAAGVKNVTVTVDDAGMHRRNRAVQICGRAGCVGGVSILATAPRGAACGSAMTATFRCRPSGLHPGPFILKESLSPERPPAGFLPDAVS
jgi:hypothetical protein